MNSLLHRFGLIDEMRLNFELEKSEMVALLQEEVAPSQLGLFSDFGDLWRSGEKAFKGKVDRQGFKIRRRRRFLEPQSNTATAVGEFTQLGRQLQLDVTILGLRPEMKFALGLIFVLLLAGSFFLYNYSEVNPWIALLLLLQFLLVTVVMGVVSRLGVKRMKRELEREIVYLIAKSGRQLSPLEEELALERLKRKA
ncbi:MAG: hypothetical protein AAF433_21895 [Bacteroidota bacterium]